jgi:hypothetical protein
MPDPLQVTSNQVWFSEPERASQIGIKDPVVLQLQSTHSSISNFDNLYEELPSLVSLMQAFVDTISD